jgi:hypothetical protein
MGTKKTAAQIRWEKRKDKVNKARRAKRKAARIEAAKAVLKSDPTTLTNKQIVAAAKAVRGSRNTAKKSAGRRLIDSAKEAAKHDDAIDALGIIAGGNVAPDNPDTRRAKEWAALGRKKGGIEKVAAEIAQMMQYSYASGRASGESGVDAKMRGARNMIDGRIVSAFIARMKLMEAQSSTGLPAALVVSGLEVVKVLDALVSAGYSATGRMRIGSAETDPEMGKAHSEVRFAS